MKRVIEITGSLLYDDKGNLSDKEFRKAAQRTLNDVAGNWNSMSPGVENMSLDIVEETKSPKDRINSMTPKEAAKLDQVERRMNEAKGQMVSDERSLQRSQVAYQLAFEAYAAAFYNIKPYDA